MIETLPYIAHNTLYAIAPLALAAIAAAPALAKAGVGIGQLIRGNKYGKAKRPKFKMPDALNKWFGNTQQALDMAKYEAQVKGLPGQGRLEAQIREGSAGANNLLTQTQQSPSAILTGLAAIDRNTKGAIADLGVEGARYRDSKLDDVYNAYESQNAAYRALADAESAQWQWDEADSYLQKMAMSSKLQDSGQRNIMGSLDNVSQIAMSLVGNGGSGGGTAGGKVAGNTIPAPSYTGDVTGRPTQGVSSLGIPFDESFNPYAPYERGADPFSTGENDDWLLYGDKMKALMPMASEESLKLRLPYFKKKFERI